MRRLSDHPLSRPSSPDLSDAEEGRYGQTSAPSGGHPDNAGEGQWGRSYPPAGEDCFDIETRLLSFTPRPTCSSASTRQPLLFSSREDHSVQARACPPPTTALSTASMLPPAVHPSSLYSFPSIAWERVLEVIHSSAGVNGGVYYFQTHGAEEIILKAGDFSRQQILSTLFLSRCGFCVPKIDIIKRGSADYLSLDLLCRDQKMAQSSPLFAPSGRHVDHVIRMEMINGHSLSDRLFHNNWELCADDYPDSFYRQLGCLAIYDTLIGNDDRICLSRLHTNTGNIMFDTEREVLRPIDQDCPFLFLANIDPFSDGSRRRIISSIPSRSCVLAEQMAGQIGLTGASSRQKTQHIDAGIREAHAQISNRQQMRSILRALRGDARLLDIPPSTLVEEFF